MFINRVSNSHIDFLLDFLLISERQRNVNKKYALTILDFYFHLDFIKSYYENLDKI